MTMQHRVLGELVNRTAKKVRANAVIAGLGAAVLAATLCLGAAITCDIAISLPVPGRVLFAVLFWGLLLAVAVLLILWPMVRPLPLTRVADWIEKTVPDLHNRLVSSLDLAADPRTRPVNPVLLQRLLDETEERLAGYRVQQVADPQPVRRLLAVAAITLVSGAALVGLFQPRSTTAIARVFRPTAPILPPSWVRIQAVTGNAKVLKGDSLTVVAKVLRGAPAPLELRLREVGGQWVTYPMEPGDADAFAFTLGSVENSYEYQVLGPRTWTDTYHIQMIVRPVVESISARIQLPAYTGIDAPQPVPEDAPQIEALVGSLVQLSVKVHSGASRGQVLLLEGVKKQETETLEHETVWIDDELPENVQTIGTWQWSPKLSQSGSLSHTFTAEESAYGFTTKLNPLEIKPGETVIFYLWTDPKDPPEELSVGLWVKGKWFSAWSDFVWGPEREGPPGKAKERRHWVGPLPEAGGWARMEVPTERASGLKSMLDRDQKGVVNGLRFGRTGGKAFFDRIAIHTRTSVTTEKIEFQQADAFPLHEEQPGLWQCEVPIRENYLAADLRFTVDMENALGYHNLRVKPILLKAIGDKAPTLIIDGPQDELVLGDPVPLPVVGQAFDDFGVDAIGFQVGTESEEEALGKPQWVETFESPERSRAIRFGLETQTSGLRRDTPIFYRLLARDRKGQVGTTSLRKAELYAAELPELPPLIAEAQKLPHAQDQAAASLRALHQSVTETQAKAWSSSGAHARLALSSEEWGRWREAHADNLSPEQAVLLKQLAGHLDARNEILATLTSSLRRGGIFSIHLDLALPYQSGLFQILAMQAGTLLLELPSTYPSHDDLRQRLAALEELAAAQSPSLERLHVQLSEFHRLDVAWASSPWPPKNLQQEAETLLTKGWGTYLLQELGMVQRHLATRRHALEQTEQQFAGLLARAGGATPEQSAALEREHEAIDPKWIEELRQVTALLKPFMTPEERSAKLPLPWTAAATAGDGKAAAGMTLTQHQEGLRILFARCRQRLLEALSAADQASVELHRILDPWDTVGPAQVERIKQILRSDEVRLLLKVADLVLADLYPQLAQDDRKKLRDSALSDLQGGGKPGRGDREGKDADGKQHLLPKDILRRLLEGETLKGPPAYQDLIDAYFRGLSQERPDEVPK
jgi:hypothetical protein